MLEATQDSV